MKPIFFIHVFLCFGLGFLWFGEALSQPTTDSLTTKKRFPLKYYVAIDPFHLAVGEWKLNVEVQWHKRWSTELDAGYYNNLYSIVYRNYVSFNTNQNIIDNKQFYSHNEGFGGNLSAKYYRKGDIKEGSFFSLTFGYRNVNYASVVTRHEEEYNPSPVCTNCYTFEHIISQTLALRIGYGWQVRVVKNVIAGFFFNLGYKAVINNSTIDGISYNVGVFGFLTPSEPQFTYDNYHIRYYQYLPSFDLGIKIGWGR